MISRKYAKVNPIDSQIINYLRWNKNKYTLSIQNLKYYFFLSGFPGKEQQDIIFPKYSDNIRKIKL